MTPHKTSKSVLKLLIGFLKTEIDTKFKFNDVSRWCITHDVSRYEKVTTEKLIKIPILIVIQKLLLLSVNYLIQRIMVIIITKVIIKKLLHNLW